MMSMGLVSSTDWLPFLASLAAKATLVLLLTALVAGLLWRSSAAVRHLVWCVGIVGVLALPVFSLLLPAWELPLLPAREAAPAAVQAPVPAPAGTVAAAPAPASAAVPPAPADEPWLPRAAALLVLAGVAAGLGWLAVGFWGVSRLGRSAQVLSDPAWLRTANEASEQLGLRRPVLLLRTRGSGMPATGGIVWPVVVVPDTAEDWSDDRRRAVLAHELAHVKRFDVLTQALAQVACALFWWHPAVWYAARRLRVERERACDDLVLLRAGTRASDYAAHLLEIARAHRGMIMATPALVSMARPSHLESRLLWVLDAARARGVPSGRATAASLLVALVAVGSLGAVRPTTAAARATGATAALLPPAEAAAPGAEARPADAKKADASGPAKEERKTEARQADAPAPAAAVRADTFPPVEDLLAMRAVGVDARYVAQMRDAGFPGLNAKQLVSLQGSGITADWAAAMADALGSLTVDDLLALRAQRVTPAFVADLRARGYTRLTAADVLGLSAMGVDAAFLDGLAREGYTDVPVQHLNGFRSLGVTPAYVAEMTRAGLTNVPPVEMQGLASAGVTAAYVSELRAAGVTGLDATAVLNLRSAGATPAYARELRQEGLAAFTAAQLASLVSNGVTPAYVRDLRAAGVTGLTAGKVLDLKLSGRGRELLEGRGRTGAP